MLFVHVARWSCIYIYIFVHCFGLALGGGGSKWGTRTKRAFSRHWTTSGGRDEVTWRSLSPLEAAALRGICEDIFVSLYFTGVVAVLCV